MMIGEYPCCEGPLMIQISGLEGLPKFSKEMCPHCGKPVWHKLSRVDPSSWTEESFLKEYEVDEKTHAIKVRNPATQKQMEIENGNKNNPA